MPEKAINVYREAGLRSFYASSPDRDPELMLVAEDRWKIEDGELVLCGEVRKARLTPNEAALAAKCGYFGLSVWFDATTAPKETAVAKPKAKGRKK